MTINISRFDTAALKAAFPKFEGFWKDYIIQVQIDALIERGLMEKGDWYIVTDPEGKNGVPSVTPYF